jgi:hypothetical protein
MSKPMCAICEERGATVADNRMRSGDPTLCEMCWWETYDEEQHDQRPTNSLNNRTKNG